ncbi:MAG: glycosyltransferase [Bacilli bacterium]|nr:glycosyltransferase [Bacilli bacterium]
MVLFQTSTIKLHINKLPENSLLIIVDNTPNQNLKLNFEKSVKYLALMKNVGIAEAQNSGIKIAIEEDCSHIVFLDQDSLVQDDYVRKIILEYERISKFLPNLFLLGPTVYNGRQNKEYKSTIHKDNYTEFDFIHRREIISSGSCVSIKKIHNVGYLDSDLFIDYVDFEWCWRANKLGFQSGITPNIQINHFVGQEEYYIGKQLIIISSPIRYYYQARNFLWLLRRKYVPTIWKINTGIKIILFTLTYPFKVKYWRQIYKYIYKGLIAGLKY